MKHLRMPRRLFVGLAYGVVVGSLASAQAQPPQAEEHWYIVKLQDQKCGYMHLEVKPVGDEVVTRSQMSMEIRRGPANLKMTVEQQYRETLEGRPLAFRQTMTLGQQPITVEGAIENGRLRLVQEQMGVKRETSYDFDPDIKLAWGMELEQRKHGLAPGTKFTVKSYDPSIKPDGPFEIDVEVHGKEPFTLPDGQKRELTKITSTMKLAMAITSNSWLDDQASPLVMDFNMGGFSLRVLHATKEQALEGAAPPELFLTTLISVEQRISQQAKSVRLRLTLPEDKDGMKMPELPNTPAQSFRRINDHEGIVTIRRLDWEAIRKGEEKPADAAMSEYLRASVALDINDRRIKRHAKKAIKGCKTPAEKADALRRYVTDFVETKNLEVGFATASEVVRSRKGDCSEHAVLLAALARAAGLPARGVSGIVQVPETSITTGKGGAFGYHMWTQVYIDGQWVDIDAALRQTDCDPTHLALAIMPLNDEGLIDSVVGILPMLGRLRIEVLEMDGSPVGKPTQHVNTPSPGK